MENEVCDKYYYVVCLVAVMFLLPHSGANLVISEPLHIVVTVIVGMALPLNKNGNLRPGL
jgi:hypothetical protein